MLTESETLAEGLPRQIARVREIRKNADSIGPAGAFLVHICDLALAKAEKAQADQDTVAMLRSFYELDSFSE